MFSLLLCLPGDMYSHDGDADEPEWVKTEREQFVEFRDKNRDGKMDKEETKDWILPSDYDHAEAEARHLVYESDQNKVGTARPLPRGAPARMSPSPHPAISAGAGPAALDFTAQRPSFPQR